MYFNRTRRSTQNIYSEIGRYINCASLSQCAIIISKVTLTFYETTNIATGGKEGETSKMLKMKLQCTDRNGNWSTLRRNKLT